VVGASNAFEEGQRAQLRREFGRAAEFFELADRLAPSPVAIRSAIRNRVAAGNLPQAATLALAARRRYGASDPKTAEAADSTLAEASQKLQRVDIDCKPACALTVDGRVASAVRTASIALFIEPGRHALEASFGDRPAEARTLVAEAGRSSVESFRSEAVASAQPTEPAAAAPAAPGAAPAAASGPSAPARSAAAEVLQAAPPPASRKPLPPLAFWIGAGATVVSGSLLLWSGLDTLSARDRYVANPTEPGYRDGVDREHRTNILIGTTVGLGVASALVGWLATDW
jgi:hypothetical protein